MLFVGQGVDIGSETGGGGCFNTSDMVIDALLVMSVQSSRSLCGAFREQYQLSLVARRLLDKMHEIGGAKLAQSYQRLGPGIDGFVEDLLCESWSLSVFVQYPSIVSGHRSLTQELQVQP